ncbi:MAG: hypothetical protein OXU66_08095 [Gammaproteobacteria bacterium]|nr:hypothetical protein [Gammaproteobacteria bacterium]MDD9958888.1 hypothetical protein [Gammaproteobacteria bacterium]
MKIAKMAVAAVLTASLTGCIGSVIGVAVDTTAEVVKAPFQLTGAVIGVTADTAGTVIAAPFRMVDAAVGGGHDHHDRDHRHDHERDGEEEHSAPN